MITAALFNPEMSIFINVMIIVFVTVITIR